MKLFRSVLAFVLLSLVAHADADEKSVTATTLKEVKVFLSGAQINRIAKTSVESGTTTLAFEGLSSMIQSNSISITGEGNVMIMSVGYRLNYLNEKPKSAELKSLEDSLEHLNITLNKLVLTENVYNDDISFLNSNKATGGANSGVNSENLKKVMDYYHQKMIDVRTRLLELADQKKKIVEKINKVNQQISELNGKLNQPTGTILVTINAKATATVNLNINYYVTGAGWTPNYDIRSENINSPVSLQYKGSVFQQTGEQWKNVKLSLSTANPVLGGKKPELNNWYLNFYEPRTYYRSEQMAPMMKDKDGLDQVVVTSANAVQKPDVTVQQNQLETEFDIQNPYSVNSDGQPVQVDIQSSTLNVNYAYFSTPKLDKDAFLMASLTGWESLNLLSGKANVYFENGYVGESFIDPSVATDTFKISLGRDKRIVVKREQVKNLSSTKFIGSNVVREFVYEISIRNTKKEAVELTVEDQIPIANNSDIKVTVNDLSNGNLKAETGMINWKVNVKPGETQKIRFGFTVKYPKGKAISNL